MKGPDTKHVYYFHRHPPGAGDRAGYPGGHPVQPSRTRTGSYVQLLSNTKDPCVLRSARPPFSTPRPRDEAPYVCHGSVPFSRSIRRQVHLSGNRTLPVVKWKRREFLVLVNSLGPTGSNSLKLRTISELLVGPSKLSL